MRVLVAIAIFSLGCSSSSTNNSTDETGGTGGKDAATGGSGGEDSGQNGGSAGSIDDSGVPDGVAGAGGSAGARPCMSGLIVVNEIAIRSLGNDEDEYVELHNLSGKPVSLDPFAIDYIPALGGTAELLWNGGFTDEIPAHGFFIIAGEGYAGAFDAKLVAAMTLEDSGGLRLRGATGAADSVSWGPVIAGHPYTEGNPANAPLPSGAIGRVPDGHDCEDNSFDFEQLNRSPGESNAF